MCKGLLGKKLGMIGLYTPKGRYIPVTVVQVGPCVVTQIKSEKTDAYKALQIGFQEKKNSRINKPIKGHLLKSGEKLFSILKEFSVDNEAEYTVGQTLTVEIFDVGEKVNVTGFTKGHGFSGVVKKYGFRGGPKTHGGMCNRLPGSIGASAWPSRVIKGKRMPGHDGNKIRTVCDLEIIDIRLNENLLLLKGCIPGANSGIVQIKKINTKGKRKSSDNK